MTNTSRSRRRRSGCGRRSCRPTNDSMARQLIEVRGIWNVSKTNSSNVLPYVIAGSAIGGAVGYLVRERIRKKDPPRPHHPDELADNVERGRKCSSNAKRAIVTDQVHDWIENAKRGIEEGELAYREVGQQYRYASPARSKARTSRCCSRVHNTVDRVNTPRSTWKVECSIQSLSSALSFAASNEAYERCSARLGISNGVEGKARFTIRRLVELMR